ncbi:uncharacterized protein J3R85_014768 [Psidium guajava]|nr:uncharacterized protein J3R85_014768 [Psidium guajava]
MEIPERLPGTDSTSSPPSPRPRVLRPRLRRPRIRHRPRYFCPSFLSPPSSSCRRRLRQDLPSRRSRRRRLRGGALDYVAASPCRRPPESPHKRVDSR